MRTKNSLWLLPMLVAAAYPVFWVVMVVALASYASPLELGHVLGSREIRYSTMLSLLSCTLSAFFSLVVAIPTGYLMSRHRFRGRGILEAMLDIPIVLPPMVVGICLLIFFQTRVGQMIEKVVPFTYSIPGVVLAQFAVAAAFSIRTMRDVFDHLSARPEDVAMTLGCTRLQAVWYVTLPAARRGVMAAGTLAWARSLGEFGPVLVFAGATRLKTEVLPSSVYLALTSGNLEEGVAVSLLMMAISVIVLVTVRRLGVRT